TAGSCAPSAAALFERGQPPLVVVHLCAYRETVPQQIAHLAHRSRHGDELGGEADLRLRLPVLHCRDTGFDAVEANVSALELVADLAEHLQGGTLLAGHETNLRPRLSRAKLPLGQRYGLQRGAPVSRVVSQ